MDMQGTTLVNGVPAGDDWTQSGEKAKVGEIKFFKKKDGKVGASMTLDPHEEYTEEKFFASEAELPKVGDMATILGTSNVVVTEARIIYSNEDCARVRITGRTIEYN